MDLVSIGLSAVLSAALFILLEFTIILPLFKRIVTKATSDMVTNQLIPTISSYIDSKIEDLTSKLTKSLFIKFRGFLGGRKKGVNSILERLADGEDLEDLEDDYEPSTIEKVVDLLDAARQYLPNPNNKGVVNNGKEKEIVQQGEDKDSIQSSTQAFIPSQIRL